MERGTLILTHLVIEKKKLKFLFYFFCLEEKSDGMGVGE